MSEAIHVPTAKLAEHLTDRGERPGADSGHPLVRAMSLADHQETRVGLWECTAGGWPVIDRSDVEICVILDGQAAITDDVSGGTFTVSTGDVLVLPAGWSGRWEVSRSVRKVFIALPATTRVPAVVQEDVVDGTRPR